VPIQSISPEKSPHISSCSVNSHQFARNFLGKGWLFQSISPEKSPHITTCSVTSNQFARNFFWERFGCAFSVYFS
jgi:hypothetical protein